MVGDLFIRISNDINLLFIGSSDNYGEISLRLHNPEQHRGYFHLVLEEGRGRFFTLLKDEIVFPSPGGAHDLTFRISREKRRHFILEILQEGKILYTQTVKLPPRNLRFLAIAGVIPLLFLISSPLLTQGSGKISPVPAAAPSPPAPAEVEKTALEPDQSPAASPTREVVIGDGAPTSTPPGPPRQEETGNRPLTEEPPPPPERQGVLFLPDSPELTALAQERLNTIPLKEGEKILTLLQVRGHCALWGTEAGRQKLSVERAEAVAGYLAGRGAKILPETIIEGLGATEPLTRDPDNQEVNRRVEILLTYR